VAAALRVRGGGQRRRGGDDEEGVEGHEEEARREKVVRVTVVVGLLEVGEEEGDHRPMLGLLGTAQVSNDVVVSEKEMDAGDEDNGNGEDSSSPPNWRPFPFAPSMSST
jgi:hypothetical protein